MRDSWCRSPISTTLAPLCVLFVALGCDGGSQRSAAPAPTPKRSAAPAKNPTQVTSSAASGPAPDASKACRRIPLFNVYRRAGAIKEQSLSRVRMELRVDLHMADCMAPDGYGHDMDLTLELEAVQGRCEIKAASARSVPFAHLEPDEPVKPWLDTFRPSQPVDLASPNLESIELRDPGTRHALVLLPYQYYFYENVVPGAPLKHALEEVSSQGCCYGDTGAITIHWYSEYGHSPLEAWAGGEATGNDLERFNRWATESELRNELPLLVRRAFELTKKARVNIEVGGGEPPSAATVTVEDGWNEEFWRREEGPHRRRLVLAFSRKPCADCETRMTPWWLWSAKGSIECATTDGGFRKTDGPCPR